MWRNSSPRRPAHWQALLALLVLGLTAACSKSDLTNIGVGLPSVQANTGAYLIDTLTVRASTVLRDSVVTSNSNYLLVGRATDPLLGTITATSGFQLGVPGDNFRIDNTFIYDSVVLVLPTDAYRYGDTTKTQALFEVRPLMVPLLATKPLYASDKISTLPYDPRAKPLNTNGVAPVRRARPNLGVLRLKLDATSFGRPLLAAGQSGRYATQDLFTTYLPGLALSPSATDNAAIARLTISSSDAGLVLYYHDPAAPGTSLNFTFGIASGGRHFYQVKADRSTAIANFKNLPNTGPLGGVPASLTGQQTVVEGALGLQTKLDFPYLTDLLQFGKNLTLTNAQIVAQVPAGTLSSYVPTPPSLTISGANILNQPVGTYVGSVPYLMSQSPVTGLDQGTYTWSVLTYVQAVLNRTLPNNGLLLSSVNPDLPSRVILGSPANAANKLQLRVYLIQVQ